MTKIIKLEIKGFKSFANKTEILFGDTFNVILGPNGSGKSNVLDALCFVLGKSGAKGLRAEKSSNLIYNGGKSKTPAKQGEVSLYLDNTDNTFPLKVKVVKISRVIKQSGQSIYSINDEKRTREQILNLLSYGNLDPNGYNIILQGDIVRLVEMSSVERRGIIEEIAGISVYEDKKKKATRELEKIEQNLNDAEIILKEREGYLKELKKERDQAITFKELTEKVKSLKATLVNVEVVERKKKIDEIEGKSSVFTKRIEEIQDTISSLKGKVTLFKKEVSEINQEIEEKGEKNQVALHKEVETLRVELATKKANLGSIKEEISKVKTQRSQLNNSLKEVQTKVSSFEKDIMELKRSLENNKKLQEEISNKITAFKKKNKLDDASSIDKRISEIDEEAESLEKVIFEIRGKQQDCIREKDRLEIQIANADERIEKVMKISKSNTQELSRLKEMKSQFKKAVTELQQCLTKDASLASQINTARGKLSSLQEELAKTRVRQASLSAMIGGNLAIKNIIENKNKFNGVYGTVAELGSVDKKYSTALDIAAGSRLNSIVVKDDKVASDCIKYLKSQKLGVATFLPINKVKGSSVNTELLGARGVVGSAIDLVKFDPKFKPIFMHVFGSTLVVENIDVARRIGIGKTKMVTLEGDLAEMSGAMRGGFLKRKQGVGFQEKKGDGEEKQEIELAKYQSLVNKLEKDRTDNQDQIDRLRELKANMEGDIIRIEKSLHLDDDDLNINKKLKKEFKEKLEVISKDLLSISSEVSTKNRALATLKIEKQKLRSEIMDMRNPIKIAELNTFEEKLTSLKTEAIRFESEYRAKEEHLGTSAELKNIKELIENNESEKIDLENKLSEIKSKINDIKEELKIKEEAEKVFMAKFKKYFTKRKTLMSQIEKEESKIIKKEEELREIEHKNTSYSLDLARINAEMNALTEEFKQYGGVPLVKPSPELKKNLWSAEQKLSRIGNVNLKALEVFEIIEEEFNKLLAKKKILIEEREKVFTMINEIDSKKQELFLKVFHVINENFIKIFQILSTKGNASMALENPKSPFDGGLNIKVRLKGSKYMDIRSLSGGEKTLTALAFLFAVQEHNPASFYIMDEVDAALDKRNAEKLASLIRSYSGKAQYVVISHNDGVISSADNLYGVSMDQHGITKVVSLKV